MDNYLLSIARCCNKEKGGCVKMLAQPLFIFYSPVQFCIVYAAFFSFIW